MAESQKSTRSLRPLHAVHGPLRHANLSDTYSRGVDLQHLQRHPRVVKPQSFEEFPPPARRKTVDTKNIPERVPFPCPVATSRESSISTSSGDTLKSSSDTTGDVADVTLRDDVFVRCLAFLKHIGENIVMPPYTIHEGLGNTFTGRRSYIDLVSVMWPVTALATYKFAQNASTTKLPLV